MLYESVFVFSGQLSPKLAEDKLKETLEIIKKAGGKILKQESWGLRSLAYKIKKNSKGYYYMINSEAEASAFSSFNIKMKQDDDFLRFLIHLIVFDLIFFLFIFINLGLFSCIKILQL